jgi:hypothetical protein
MADIVKTVCLRSTLRKTPPTCATITLLLTAWPIAHSKCGHASAILSNEPWNYLDLLLICCKLPTIQI